MCCDCDFNYTGPFYYIINLHICKKSHLCCVQFLAVHSKDLIHWRASSNQVALLPAEKYLDEILFLKAQFSKLCHHMILPACFLADYKELCNYFFFFFYKISFNSSDMEKNYLRVYINWYSTGISAYIHSEVIFSIACASFSGLSLKNWSFYFRTSGAWYHFLNIFYGEGKITAAYEIIHETFGWQRLLCRNFTLSLLQMVEVYMLERASADTFCSPGVNMMLKL